MHYVLSTHHPDFHRPFCCRRGRGREGSDQLRLHHTSCDVRQKRCIRTMFFCCGGTERWLEEVKIASRCNFLCVDKIAIGHGVMFMSLGHSTTRDQSLPRPALKRYEQRVNTINKLIVWFQRWGGSADGAVIFGWGISKSRWWWR